MENELRYNEIAAGIRKPLGKSQAAVECELRTGEKIVKILSASASGAVNAYEALNGEASVSGAVDFKVLYSNAEGAVRVMDYRADFSDKFCEPTICPKDKLSFTLSVLDTDVEPASSDGVKIAAAVEISGERAEDFSVKYISECGGGLYAKKSECAYGAVTGSFDARFPAGGEYEARDNISQIYSAEPCAVIHKCSAGEGLVTVEGEVVTTVTYNDSFERGEIKCVSVVSPFKEEIAAVGVCAEDKVCARVCVSDFKAVCETDAENPSDVFRLDLEVRVSGYASRKKSEIAVTDAFSLTRDDKVKRETFYSEAVADNFYYREKTDGAVTLADESPEAEELCALTANRVSIANAVAGADEITLEGIITTGVIYVTKEGVKNSVAAELPYSFRLRADGVTPDMRLSACGSVSDISGKVRRDKEIDIAAQVDFYVTASERIPLCAVTEITEGEAARGTPAAIGIYSACENESLWEIAKTLRLPPEEIGRQNPDLKTPTEGGEKILVYRQA